MPNMRTPAGKGGRAGLLGGWTSAKHIVIPACLQAANGASNLPDGQFAIAAADVLEDACGLDPLVLLAAFVGRDWRAVSLLLRRVSAATDVTDIAGHVSALRDMVDEGRAALVAGAPSPLRSSAWAANLVFGGHE